MTSNNVTLLVKGDLGCSGGEEHVFSTIPPCPSSHMRCGFRVRARTKSPRKVFSGARQAPLILESFFYLHAHVSMDTRDWHWMSSLITLHLKKFHSIFLFMHRLMGAQMSVCVWVYAHVSVQVNMLMHMWRPEEGDPLRAEVTGMCGTYGFLCVCWDLNSGPQDCTESALF